MSEDESGAPTEPVVDPVFDAVVDVEPAPDAALEPEPEPGRPALEQTGHAGVDRVLASLEALEDRSVHEHVAVFEDAHTSLRRALDESDPQA